MPELYRWPDITRSLRCYWQRLALHRQWVYEYALALGLGQTFFDRLCLRLHDWDKYLPIRYYIYARYFHDKHSDVRVVEAFRLEAKKHISMNRHHWGYWCDESGHPTQMPERDVLEMIADWQAMSREKGTDVRKWFEGSLKMDALTLHPATLDFVRNVLQSGQ